MSVKKTKLFINTEDDTGLDAKVLIRKTMLSLHKKNQVLDLFQGIEKKMFKSCYEGNPLVESYKGYDVQALNLSERMDNKKAIFIEDLDEYNFFDLDAYKTPWELVLNIIIRLEKKGKKSFVVTDGVCRSNRFSSTSKLQKACMNIPKRLKVPSINRHQNFFLARLFHKIDLLTGFKVISFKQATLEDSKAKYYGFEIQK